MEASARVGLDHRVNAKRLGLHLPVGLPYEAWQRIGRQLAIIADSSGWWLGDWLIYGESHYADRYKRAIRETMLEYQTLRNYAWVARSFPVSRRRDKLSFQHHAEVAALTPTEQDRWLDRAVLGAWSRNELRRQLRNDRGGSELASAEESNVSVQFTVSPEQERRWKAAAEQACRDFGDWVIANLDHAADQELKLFDSRTMRHGSPGDRALPLPEAHQVT